MIPFWKKTGKDGKKKPQKPAVPRTAQISVASMIFSIHSASVLLSVVCSSSVSVLTASCCVSDSVWLSCEIAVASAGSLF